MSSVTKENAPALPLTKVLPDTRIMSAAISGIKICTSKISIYLVLLLNIKFCTYYKTVMQVYRLPS